VSGAGKAPSERTHFSGNHGSVAAYALFSSSHARDRAGTGRTAGDVPCPHLVPLDRGILETIYVRVKKGDQRGHLPSVSRRLLGRRLRARHRRPAAEIKHVATPTTATSAGSWMKRPVV
jgi:N-acetyl-gamma-glutamyl-phosphate reductase